MGSRLRASARNSGVVVALFISSAVPAWGALNSLRIEDYATLPITGSESGSGNSAYLARGSFLAEEPSNNTNRMFVSDLNGPLYILDKVTRGFTPYLNFNGRDTAPGLFDRFAYSSGLQSGLVSFEFDPAYVTNGKFYTIHTEDPSAGLGSQLPDTTNYPNLDASNFGVTTSVDAPGNSSRHGVLLEWTDTDRANNTFEGSVRELLRIDSPGDKNPMADIIFNPTAGPDDADWRVMYLAVGDGGAAENGSSPVRRAPQILSSLNGKILRLRPDVVGAQLDLTQSANGKYYIPDDNPFTAVTGTNASHVRNEIWALGLRNPHRLSWDVDPLDPEGHHFFASDVGLFTWEEVNLLQAGKNYGYVLREGNQVLISNDASSSVMGPLPSPDVIPNEHICAPTGFTSCTSNGTISPTYAVIQYGRALDGQDPSIAGDSIAGGFVYRGSLVPELYGKFVFADSTTGRVFYSELADVLAAEDGDVTTMAAIQELTISWDNPNDAPNDGEELYDTISAPTSPGSMHAVQVRGPMFQIVEAGYDARGGTDPNLPGAAGLTGPYGRADIQLAVDGAGEIYILSKSDGMIRAIVGPQPMPGDFNFDGSVDAGDYDAWKTAYGQPVPFPGWGPDGNADGVIDAADYTVWRNLMAGGAGGFAQRHASVPEPASLMVMLATIGLTTSYRRRCQSDRASNCAAG